MEPVGKILVVDDDPAMLTATRLALQAGGHKVFQAADGQGALEAVRRHQPDLVLMDVNLTDMDGYEVCRQIKADAAKSSPFLAILTGSRLNVDDRVKGLEMGADDYILRPISNRELLARVKAMLRIRAQEQALAASAQLFRATFNAVSDGILLTDADFTIVQCNPAATRLYGKPREEIIGKKCYHLLQHTNYPILECPLKDVKTTKQRQTLIWDQSGRWLEIKADPLLDAQGNFAGMVHVITDITEHKVAEQIIIESQAYLRAVLDSVNDAVFVDDAETGEIIDVNQRMCEMYGYAWEEALLLPLGALSQGEPPYSQADALAWLSKARQHGPQTFEWLARHKDGHLFWVEVNIRFAVIGGKHRFVVVVRDITDRRRAEDDMRRRSEELAALNAIGREISASLSLDSTAAAAMDGIMKTIKPDLAYLFLREGEILSLHQARCLDEHERPQDILTGRVGECICGLAIQEKRAIFSLDIFEDLRCTWEECKRNGVRSFAALPLFSGDEVFAVIGLVSKTERDYARQAEFLETLASQVAAALVNARLFKTVQEYATQLEERVAARTYELRQTQEQLVRQEKLAVLGQLAGSVGHELRNPLSVIKNAVYFLKLIQPEADERLAEYLGIIARETQNAEKIINDLLDFARIKSVDQEPVRIPDLIASVVERYPPPPNVHLTVTVGESLPLVLVDIRQAAQVLGNLVVNAYQAMPSGGDLTLSAVQNADEIAIMVQDTGEGISPENMQKLFEPLFTTKIKGIGLGLSVSKKMVEANGGRIEVQSQLGIGSTFTIVLPVYP